MTDFIQQIERENKEQQNRLSYHSSLMADITQSGWIRRKRCGLNGSSTVAIDIGGDRERSAHGSHWKSERSVASC